MSQVHTLNNYFFSELPIDMWNEIFSFLIPLDVICTMLNVCKAWRTIVVKYYFQNYLQKEDYSTILNNIDELFNNKTFLQKFKRYLFRQYIKQKAQLFSQFAQYESSSYAYASVYSVDCKEFTEKEINEINIYCNLFTMPQNTEPNTLQQPNTATANSEQPNSNDTTNSVALMFGLSGVGKTSFLSATAFKEFNNPWPLSCQCFIKTHKFRKDNLPLATKLYLWDVDVRKTNIARSCYKGTCGFFICFDLNWRESFDAISIWMKEIENYEKPNTRRREIILLGTKSDLVNNWYPNYYRGIAKIKQVVKKEEAEKLEFEMDLIYVETSSKEMKNVDYPTWYLVLIDYCFNKFKKE